MAPESRPNKQVTYSDAGVDTAEGARAVDAIRDSVRSTYRDEVIGDIGGFGGMFSAAGIKDMDDPVLVSATDGVGTKLKLAQLLGIHDTVGIDLVAMCVNDLVVAGAEPLFFLDYMAVGKLEADHAAQVVAGIAEGCRQSGCALVGGEMAEHPGVMPDKDYDLAGFCVGAVERTAVIDGSAVKPGDTILGIASNGFHSNGFSLVRRVLIDTMTKEELLAPTEALGGTSIGEAALAPTRIYVKTVLDALGTLAPNTIKAIANITGGGITENLDRVLPKSCDALVDVGSWDVPSIITMAVEKAGLSESEALKTFNMGIGMALVCAPEDADAVRKQLESSGETVFEIGEVVAGEGKVAYK